MVEEGLRSLLPNRPLLPNSSSRTEGVCVRGFVYGGLCTGVCVRRLKQEPIYTREYNIMIRYSMFLYHSPNQREMRMFYAYVLCVCSGL